MKNKCKFGKSNPILQSFIYLFIFSFNGSRRGKNANIQRRNQIVNDILLKMALGPEWI